MNRRQGVAKHVKEEIDYMDEYDKEELEDNYNEGKIALIQMTGNKFSMWHRL